MLLTAATKAATAKHAQVGIRPVLKHRQFLRQHKVDAVQPLGLFLPMVPMHTFNWDDWLRDLTVGPVSAENASPTGWVRPRGIMFGTHHDAPVVFPDSMHVRDATLTRKTRSGDILVPQQQVDVMTAPKAMTVWPAWQYFEEDKKGSLEAGKLAAFVVLSGDPTALDPSDLDSQRGMAPIEEDKVIFETNAEQNETPVRPGSYLGVLRS